MAALLRMPEIAAAATTAIVSAWPLGDGTDFTEDETIAVIETEKAEVDLPASADGRIIRTLVPAGSTVAVGDPIALLGAPGENPPDVDALLAELGVASAPGAEPAPPRRDVADVAGVPETPTNEQAADAPPGDPAPARQERIFASPLARQMAKRAGIALGSLHGTGPGGRITRRDVDAAIAGQAASARPREPAAVGVGGAETADTRGSGFQDTPASRMRSAIARHLVRSKQEIPHFYLRATCRVDALLALRNDANANSDTKISVNDLLIKAIAVAHGRVPRANVIWTDEAIRQFDTVDISVAIATEAGLVTPVLRGVDAMSLSTVAARVRGYIDRARSGRLDQRDLEGGSITITNLGMFGIEEFSAIINPPQSAILAVGQARPEPVVVDGRVEAAQVMHATLSVDHRPIDGALAAQWMRAFVEAVENPLRLLV